MIINRAMLSQSIRQIALFSTLAISSGICFAGIYKWVDAEGNVHYGQQRPADAASERMEVQQHAPQDVSTYNRPGTNKAEDPAKDAPTDGTEKKPEAAAEPEKKKETPAEKKRRLAACAQARKNLATMQSVGRIRSKDKEGNTTYLSQQQKEARIKQAKELISKHCK